MLLLSTHLLIDANFVHFLGEHGQCIGPVVDQGLVEPHL